jgi:8-amino-7-oxononanoate synthase
MRHEPERQARVRALAREVRGQLRDAGLNVAPGDSPIIPVVIGDEGAAIEASKRLTDARLLVPAVRPPTVAKGSSRLRVTVCSEHTDDEVRKLVEVLTGRRDGLAFDR